jgi:uncharacterized protein YkwD
VRIRQFPSSTVLLAGVAAIVAVLPCGAQQLAPASDSTTVAEQYLLAAANQERAALGLGLLHRDAQLASAAAQHAREMAARATISHQFPGEAELTTRAAEVGVAFSVVSENVAEAPSAVLIHQMWMQSEHHRDNLLDPAIDAAGISVIARDGELYAVEDFAKTVRAVSFEQQESAIALLITQPGTVVDAGPVSTGAARQTCAMETGYAGTRKPWFVMRFTSDSLTQLPAELKTRLASGRYHQAAVGACANSETGNFTAYNLAVMLFP